jgi:hypothetical protein
MFDSAQLLSVTDIDVMLLKNVFWARMKMLTWESSVPEKSDSGSEWLFPGLEAYLEAT